MNNQRTGSVSNTKSCTLHGLMITAVAALIMCLPFGAPHAETLWTPSVNLIGIHDDNIQFTRTEPEDDYIYTLEPRLQLNYDRELTRIYTQGSVFFRRYQDNDDLNDEIYNFDFRSDTNVTERLRLRSSYEFIKDTTLDSELQEIGRIFFREDRLSHNAMLTPRFNLTERMSIGLSGRYRRVDYDSDTKVDYSVWDINLPLRWQLITKIDTIYISPGYTYRDSDISRSNSYNLRVGWDHEKTERLNLNFSIGARYTEIEDLDTDSTDSSWSGLGDLQLDYDFETGNVAIDFQHSLRSTADGNQVNVTRVTTRLRWNFTERIGMELNGSYYYTQNEGQNDDDTSQFYQAGSDLFYHLTENHTIFTAYQYSQDYEEEIEDDPRTERNRIWAGIRLKFPMI